MKWFLIILLLAIPVAIREIWLRRIRSQLCLVKKSIPTVDEALAQIPPFVMPEQQKVGE